MAQIILLKKLTIFQSAYCFKGRSISEMGVEMLSTDYLFSLLVSEVFFLWIKDDFSRLCLGIKVHADVQVVVVRIVNAQIWQRDVFTNWKRLRQTVSLILCGTDTTKERFLVQTL